MSVFGSQSGYCAWRQPAATTLPVVPDYWRCIPTAGLIHQYPAWSVQVFNHIAAQVVTDQVRPQSAVASCCSVRVTSPIYSVDYQLFLRLAPGSPRGWTRWALFSDGCSGSAG